LLILLQDRIALQELQHLADDIEHLILHLVKDPLVVFARSEDAGVFQVDQVTGCLGLREFQNCLQVGDAHFPVGEDELENAQPGGIGTGEENLRSGFDVKVLQPHGFKSK